MSKEAGEEKGMIPKIDIIKWYDKLDLSIYEIASLVDLFEEARNTNMMTNEMIRRMVKIVRYYTRAAKILGVTPSTVSRRAKGRAGITDRVLSTPSVSDIGHVLELFGIRGSTCFQLVEIYRDNPTTYSTPDGLRGLLNAFNVYSKADAIVKHLFF